MAIVKNLKAQKFDELVKDLLIEFSVGGDRFDHTDIDMVIQGYRFDREALYNRLHAEAIAMNNSSVKDGLGEIISERFFVMEAQRWLFDSFDKRQEAVQDEDGKWNIKTDGQQLLSPNLWFDKVGACSFGLVKVWLGEHSNFLLSNGSLLSPQWFDSGLHFYEGLAVVGREGRQWFIDRNNRSISGDRTFLECRSFYNNLGMVKNDDGMWSYIDRDGSLAGHYEDLTVFRDKSAFVKKDDNWYQINRSGERLNDIPVIDVKFTRLRTLHMVTAKVDGKLCHNIMHDSGKLILPGWTDRLVELPNSTEGYNISTLNSLFQIGPFKVLINAPGKYDESPELMEYLGNCPKVKKTDKKSNSLKM